MASSVDRLVELIPPPEGGANIDWVSVEERLGFSLPADYTTIVETYGSGLFGDEVTVWVPGGAGGEDLLEEGPAAVDILGEFGEFIAEDHQTWVEPDGSESAITVADVPDGFSPWGGGASGAYGFWHRVGADPNTWPVLYADFREGLYLYHRGGLAAFICDLLTGHYPSDRIAVVHRGQPTFTRIPQ